MANTASVKYKVSGKYDNKGMNQAVEGVKRLGNAAKAVTNIAKGLMAAFAVKAVFNFASKAVDAFGQQEQAVIRLNAAIRNNSNLNAEASRSLQQYAAQLQRNSKYGDEEIIQQQALLATMGMSEEQINAIMQASVDLASTGMMSLDSAVKNLAKTYSGMTGELGEAIPALRDLTAEQLRAGEGVEAVAEMYAGMGAAVAQGVEGQKAQLKNMFGDIMEQLGGAILPVVNNIISALVPVFNKISEWFADNQTQIINFFTHLPQIASLAFKGIVDVFKTYFSKEFWAVNGSAMWVSWADSFKLALQWVWNIIKSLGVTIWEPMKYGFEMMIYGIKNVFVGIIEWFVEKLNDIGRLANEVGNLFRRNDREYEGIDYNGRDNLQRPENNIAENISTSWGETSDIGAQMVESFKNSFQETGTLLAEPWIEGFENFLPEFREILNEPITAINNATETIAGGEGTAGGQGSGPLQEVFTKVGEYFTTTIEGLGGTLSSLITSFNTIKAVMDPISVIIGGIMKVLEPVISKVLAPLLNALNTIGMVIGNLLIPIFNALAPIISVLTNILMTAVMPILQLLTPPLTIVAAVFEVLAPLIKMVAVAFEVLSSPVRFLGDLFTWIADTIKTAVHNFVEIIEHPFNKNKRNMMSGPGSFKSDAFSGLPERIANIMNAGSGASNTGYQDIFGNVGDITTGFDYAGSTYGDGSGSGGSSSQVTRPPDIHIHMTNEGVLAGDEAMDDFLSMFLDRMEQRNILSASSNIVIARA
jgi:phage-related protein